MLQVLKWKVLYQVMKVENNSKQKVPNLFGFGTGRTKFSLNRTQVQRVNAKLPQQRLELRQSKRRSGK